MKRIVILFEDTGGGHRSTAEAIAQGVEAVLPGQFEIELVNGTPYLPWPFNRGEQSYPYIVNRARGVHALIFHALNGRRRAGWMRRYLRLKGGRQAEQLLADHPADVYVSCHPVFSQFLPPAVHRARSVAGFAHVVTDLLSGHAAHYARDLDLCCVPTQQARRQALANRVPADRVTLTGQPVWLNLRERMADSAGMRTTLALDPGVPVALLVGGADGMGRLGPTAHAILESDLNLQLVVVCGRNDALREELGAAQSRLRLRVLGFVDIVPELMGAADMLLTKAGTLTLCEGFIAGLPILIYDAIPGQETGNVKYVVGAGAGKWCPHPKDVIRQLAAWTTDTASLAAARLASSRLAQPQAALEVARAVIALS